MDIKKFYFIKNGNVTEIETPILEIDSPAILYGYNIFETMRVEGRKIIFYREHMKRFKRGLIFFKFEVEIETVKEILDNFLSNKINSNGIFRISIFKKREGALLYLKFSKINHFSFPISAYTFKTRLKPVEFNKFKTGNFMLYHLSRSIANENNCYTSLLFDKNIVEFSSGNILYREKNLLYTPPLSTGCMDGIMRKFLLKNKIVKVKNLSIGEIKKISELYLINSVRIIMPIKKLIGENFEIEFENKSYEKIKEKITSLIF